MHKRLTRGNEGMLLLSLSLAIETTTLALNDCTCKQQKQKEKKSVAVQANTLCIRTKRVPNSRVCTQIPAKGLREVVVSLRTNYSEKEGAPSSPYPLPQEKSGN